MKIKRRTFFSSVGLAACALARGQNAREIATDGKDTFIILFDDGVGGFGVGVRTSVKADNSLVEVFYDAESEFGKLLLSKRSMAPVAGTLGYGATRDTFTIPRKDVRFINVTFFREIGKRSVMPVP